MFRYSFVVDKDTCFTYWAQSLIEWGWYFEKKECDFYRKFSKQFTPEEEKALGSLKQILEKEENYFLWLWARYANMPIENTDELREWNQIKKVLLSKFEDVWREEMTFLEQWKKNLESYPFQRFEQGFENITRFFEAPIISEEEVKVKLAFHYDTEAPTAHVKKEFPGLIILNISRTNVTNINRAVNTLLHETIHLLMEYRSTRLESLLYESYMTTIAPPAIQLKNHKWKYLLMESVVGSFASRRLNNYFGRIIESDKKIIESDIVGNFDREKQKENYGFLTRVVAERIEPLTTSYLNKQKKVDAMYADAVAKTLLELLSTKRP